MRFVYICADAGVPLFGRKGASTHIREFCIALQDAGHQVKLFVTNPGEDLPRNSPLEFSATPPSRRKWLSFDLRCWLNSRRLYRSLADYLQSHPTDVIYERYGLYSTAGIRAKRRFKLPLVVEINAPLVHEQRFRLRAHALARLVEKRIVKAADLIVTVSDELKKRIVQWGVKAERVLVFPTAVNPELFKPEVAAAKPELAESFNVGYAGTFNYYQGIRYLFRLAEHLREKALPLRILVIGGVEEKRARYARQAHEQKLDHYLIFLPSVPFSRMPAYLKLLDIGLVPDHSPWAFPTKIAEYGAMGIPVIAAAYPPMAQFMSPVSPQILFPPGDVEKMLERILWLYHHSQERQHIAEQLRKKVLEELTWKATVTKFEKAIAERLPAFTNS